MFYVTSYKLAVALSVLCMLCWGSWGNTQKLVGGRWRYELFYWDYVVGLLILSLVMGFTGGSWGNDHEWSFFANLRESFGVAWVWPFLAGVLFNAANLLFSAAIAVAGMAVAFPIGSGLAGVGGTLFNYLLAPSGKSLGLITMGLLLVVLSIFSSSLAFKVRESASASIRRRHGSRTGIVLAAAAGFLMMWFSPLINLVIDYSVSASAPAEGKMTAYSAVFVFAVGVFLSNFVWDAIAMRHPVAGEPIAARAYFKGGFRVHWAGIAGGAIWGLGTLVSFVSSGAASPAIAYALGQGATLVSASWGIFVWKEFADAPRLATYLNVLMFALFLAGLAVLIVAGM